VSAADYTRCSLCHVKHTTPTCPFCRVARERDEVEYLLRELVKIPERFTDENYPTDVFPEDGTSLDCKSARMARLTASNIVKRQRDLIDGLVRESFEESHKLRLALVEIRNSLPAWRTNTDPILEAMGFDPRDTCDGKAPPHPSCGECGELLMVGVVVCHHCGSVIAGAEKQLEALKEKNNETKRMHSD